MGYCGGTKDKPSYYRLGDHTEAIAIDYDPKVLSYEQLLGYFWSAHRCGSINSSRQYRNAVFYRNDEQKSLAESSLAVAAKRSGIPVEDVTTDIVPMGTFTYAEGYHQKYALTRHRALRKFLTKTYPDTKAFADSTVATRLNAYIGGADFHWPDFLRDLDSYGLPPALEAKLRQTDKGHR